MFKKLNIKTQQKEVASLTSKNDTGILSINTSNSNGENSLLFEIENDKTNFFLSKDGNKKEILNFSNNILTISSNVYMSSSLAVNNLNVSNLTVTGTRTIIETEIYQTENLQIINDDNNETSFKIEQTLTNTNKKIVDIITKNNQSSNHLLSLDTNGTLYING